MPVFARVSDHLRGFAVAVATACAAGLPAAAEPPARVVSVNLCTDQLAMLLAAPGQLVSVSRMAREPESSAMAAEAGRFPVNSGAAEEVFLLRPDLVLAGQYTTRASVDLLRRLGVKVAVFAPETSFDDIRANIARMGRVLGREAAAARMLAEFDAALAGRAVPGGDPVGAALYHANGYTPGPDTLASDILAAAGMENVAARAGLTSSGTLPLERLVLAAPEVVITGARYAGASRSEEILDHPALAALPSVAGARTGPDWVCGTPHVLRAVADMVRVRDAISQRR